MGAPGGLRARSPAGWCEQAQSELGRWGTVVVGTGGRPKNPRLLVGVLLADPSPRCSSGQEPPPRSQVVQAPRGFTRSSCAS